MNSFWAKFITGITGGEVVITGGRVVVLPPQQTMFRELLLLPSHVICWQILWMFRSGPEPDSLEDWLELKSLEDDNSVVPSHNLNKID